MLRGPIFCLAAVIVPWLMFPVEAKAQGRANLAQDRAAIANGWHFDYQAAREEARNSNKPMMVVLRCVP